MTTGQSHFGQFYALMTIFIFNIKNKTGIELKKADYKTSDTFIYSTGKKQNPL